MSESMNNFHYVLLPAQDDKVNPIISAIVKRTYDITGNGQCVIAEQQEPLLGADRFYENKDPVTASCLMESDFIPYKVATDVVVIARAYAPKGKPVQMLETSVSIGEVTKKIRVIGNRKCIVTPQQSLIFSEPEPFTEMEIRYERAYGGVDLASFGVEAPMIYPRNPLGKAFVIKSIRKVVEGLELPNLEDPDHLLTPNNIFTNKMEEWQKQPMPAGFGWYGKLWYPRCSFAGVLPAYMSLYDEIREAAMGLIPADQVEQFKKFKMPMLDFKFFNGAVPGLALPYLKGDETIKLENLDPEKSHFELKLPGTMPRICIDIGDGFQYPEVCLHTVCILKEENRMYSVWRGAIGYEGPEKLDSLKKMDIIIEEE